MIYGERVRQARELKGLTQARLASLIGVSQAAIAQIESGAFIASDEMIAEISRRTGQTVSFFSQPPARELQVGSLLFRAHASMTKRDMNQTCRSAEYVYQMYLKMRSRLRTIPAKIPQLGGVDPTACARETRKALGIPLDAPVPHLINLLEWHGVVVVIVPDVKSRDAFSVWDEQTPIVALAAGRSGDRARMSVSHELGHLVMHSGRSRFEIADEDADEFAAEFLMPQVAMIQEIRAPVTLSSLAELKPRWKVSIQALIRRAKGIGTITDRQYRYLYEHLSGLGWRKSEPVQIIPEQPRAFRQMAEMLYGDPVDVHAMAHDLRTTSEFIAPTLEQYAPKGQTPTTTNRGNVVSLTRRRANN